MQRNNKYFFMRGILAFLLSGLMITVACAGIPLWTFKALTEATIAVPSNAMAMVQYRVTNQSKNQHTLSMRPIQGIVQVTTGQGVCGKPFVLKGNSYCTLSLKVSGSQLKHSITGGPVVCQQGNPNQCYRPSSNADALHITQAPPIIDAVIGITGPPLELTASGSSGQLTIENTSTDVTATNIQPDFTDTILEGNVTYSEIDCQSVAPQGSCILTFSPGSTAVAETNFPIQGDNTNELTAAIVILPAPPSDAVISVKESPLQLTANGSSGQLTIQNTSTDVTATNIVSNFTDTALDGNVTETGNTCASVPPGGSCTLTYTPGSTVVSPQTNFTIQGTNTNALTAAIAIESGITLTNINPTSGTASGGTGFTLTGTGLTGATSVTVDETAATSVNVVNSTTVTGVTPAHAAGAVDVVIDTPAGGATLANGYTYEDTVVGQAAFGGTIACLDGGLNNLIAATGDNSTDIEWGGLFTTTNAQSNTDGAGNTTAIVTALGNNGGTSYAAQLCDNFEIDSQGNTPCQAGNTCYDDWFLPAKVQTNCLFANKEDIGGFANGNYWSSTEFSGQPASIVWSQLYRDGVQVGVNKGVNFRVRCVRAFTP